MSTDIFRVDEYDMHMPKPYRIGHNVAVLKDAVDKDLNCPKNRLDVLKDLAGKGMLWHITNVSKLVPPVTSVASASLPAATANFDLGNISKWLETSDDTFYDVNIGFITSQYSEWEVFYPQGQLQGGTKTTPSVKYIEDDSSYFDPKLSFLVWKDNWIPYFKLYNQSQYTLRFAKLRAVGYKYSFVPVKDVNCTPNMVVDWRVLEEVRVG